MPPLFSRSARLEDLLANRRDLLSSYGADEDMHRNLSNVWRFLSERSSLVTTLVEEGGDPAHRTPIHTIAGVFVDDEFIERLRRSPGRTIAELLVAEVLAGGGGIMDLARMREVQTEHGLNFVIMHSKYFRTGKPDVSSNRDIEAAFSGLANALRGYRLRTYYVDAVSTESRDWLLSGGMSIVERSPGDVGREPSKADPLLLGMDRREAEAAPGKRLSTLFVVYEPIFGLKATFRELLAVALRGSTDKQIAEELSLSVPAVKRRWERLYVHVEEILPELWKAWSGEAVESARGSERRRHLLNYFREHPEEMRPWVD